MITWFILQVYDDYLAIMDGVTMVLGFGRAARAMPLDLELVYTHTKKSKIHKAKPNEINGLKSLYIKGVPLILKKLILMKYQPSC